MYLVHRKYLKAHITNYSKTKQILISQGTAIQYIIKYCIRVNILHNTFYYIVL